MNPFLVVTTIAGSDHPVLQRLARGCREHHWELLVIGDRKSPPEFDLQGAQYFDLEQQVALPLAFPRACPENHYARKNVGYLVAMRSGGTVIAETDDDNEPLEAFFNPPQRKVAAAPVDDAGWVNVYGYFNQDGPTLWPRGFPLDLVQGGHLPQPGDPVELDCPIQQGLADDNPDVDAVYRLLFPLPVRFSSRAPVALGKGTVCPFNSQNTLWWPDAWPLLYLPATCSFRMTDIWRSFVATRVAHSRGWHVLFTEPTVRQERNEHDLMRDFSDEVPGYLSNTQIWRVLCDLDLTDLAAGQALRRCYEALEGRGWVEPAELTLVDAWLADLRTLEVTP